jgi:hypothetical protein
MKEQRQRSVLQSHSQPPCISPSYWPTRLLGFVLISVNLQPIMIPASHGPTQHLDCAETADPSANTSLVEHRASRYSVSTQFESRTGHQIY